MTTEKMSVLDLTPLQITEVFEYLKSLTLKQNEELNISRLEIEELQWDNDGLKQTIKNQAFTIRYLYKMLEKYEKEPRDNLIYDETTDKWIKPPY